MQKEKLEKYKYTDIHKLSEDIENDTYTFVLKLQSFTKSQAMHQICLKSALLKNKVIVALKSLLFLQSHHPESHVYAESIKLFSEYVNTNKEKINESILSLIYSRVELLKNSENLSKFLSEVKHKVNSAASNEKLTTNILIEIKEAISNNKEITVARDILKFSHHDQRSIKSEVIKTLKSSNLYN